MKKRLAVCAFLLLGMLSLGIPRAKSQNPNDEHRHVLVPDTSVEDPGDVGLRAHTNHLIRTAPPEGGLGPGGGMSPAQIRSFYNMPAAGGSNVIAIVDAFNYPTALNDFNVFSAQFGLPQETSTNVLASTNQVFPVVYATGRKPRTHSGWGQEAAPHIPLGPAIAPSAK